MEWVSACTHTHTHTHTHAHTATLCAGQSHPLEESLRLWLSRLTHTHTHTHTRVDAVSHLFHMYDHQDYGFPRARNPGGSLTQLIAWYPSCNDRNSSEPKMKDWNRMFSFTFAPCSFVKFCLCPPYCSLFFYHLTLLLFYSLSFLSSTLLLMSCPNFRPLMSLVTCFDTVLYRHEQDFKAFFCLLSFYTPITCNHFKNRCRMKELKSSATN